MYKRGQIQSYLGLEERTSKETKGSYYNLETTWITTFFLLLLGLMGCMESYK
jgi:hypothetical protein